MVMIRASRDIHPTGQPWLPLGLVEFAMYHGYGVGSRVTKLEKTLFVLEDIVYGLVGLSRGRVVYCISSRYWICLIHFGI